MIEWGCRQAVNYLGRPGRREGMKKGSCGGFLVYFFNPARVLEGHFYYGKAKVNVSIPERFLTLSLVCGYGQVYFTFFLYISLMTGVFYELLRFVIFMIRFFLCQGTSFFFLSCIQKLHAFSGVPFTGTIFHTVFLC